ncbi:BEN domain-containing protein 2 isoform X3 [Rousettus aegyptiacus]|uniref:BEN domain-containing protein 2 isoform X3 n=1 Tax=Rousettus aegyptiacus TaxID=9407 RepID=UPI00168CF9EE|nr:BEN domain-containing protein 2 isoform X3 [Rousettus aegyptiacus]
MSEEQDYIIVTIDDDSDNNNDEDDDDVVVIEDSETESTENTDFTDSVPTTQPNFQGNSDNYQPPYQMSYGVESLAELSNQPASQMNHPGNLKRFNPNSGEVEFIPSYRNSQFSNSKEDDMGLQDLIKSTNRQVNQLCGIVSKMQHSWEKPPFSINAFQQQFCHNENPAAAPQEYRLANAPEMMNYSTLMENNSMRPNAASSSLYNSPNFEMQSKGETIPEDGAQIMYYPAVFGNNSSSSVASSTLSIPPNFEMVVRAGTNPDNNIQMVNNPNLMENDSDQDGPCFFIPADCDSSTEMQPETMIHTTSVENGSDQDNANESFFLTAGFALLPIEILVKAENNMDNSHETATRPTVVENNNSQNSSSSTNFPTNSGFLGDPERNVRILNLHLMVAQRKAEPKLAARYLARILFSKDVLVCSSAGVSSRVPNLSGRQPLDPNKMAAIREYLATAFPNHDLRECGKDWKTCISYINSLIRYVCSDSKRISQKTVARNKVPTNTNTLASADLNDKKDGDGGESSSQLSQQAAASETGANGTSQQNSSAFFERFKQRSTVDIAVPFETVYYLGNPRRNIRIPFSVLTIAKAKCRPELSARYLVRKLFAEEVLIKSFQGNLARGVCALNLNTMNALQEFLQENYPNCDLTESGYDWKLCVTAINSCIRSIRYEFNKSTSKSEPLPATTPSAK